VASTEARLRSFMRDLPEPSAAPLESPEYSGTPETQPCSGADRGQKRPRGSVAREGALIVRRPTRSFGPQLLAVASNCLKVKSLRTGRTKPPVAGCILQVFFWPTIMHCPGISEGIRVRSCAQPIASPAVRSAALLRRPPLPHPRQAPSSPAELHAINTPTLSDAPLQRPILPFSGSWIDHRHGHRQLALAGFLNPVSYIPGAERGGLRRATKNWHGAGCSTMLT
jgi:hypothetical protein